jgi:ABC-type transport system involved in multi-copper enzyme maturation permease subunit
MLGPIFVREWLTLPRRPPHYAVRTIYLGLFLLLGLTAWQATIGWTRPSSLGDTARFGRLLFDLSVHTQLTLLLFFAALSAAAAVCQEKDRRTFVLLLLTDLRNREIVLGKLAGALLQIGLLLLGSFGMLALVLLLGGVTGQQVAQAALVLAGACLAAGSLGCLVALWRDQTFPTLALTVLLLVLYFCGVRALAGVPVIASWFSLSLDPALFQDVQLWFDPYQCLHSVLDPPLDFSLPLSPAAGFTACMLLLAAALNGWSIFRLRRWNPSNEPSRRRQRDEEENEKHSSQAHAAPGRVRPVWHNPILWREIRTRGYGRRPLLVKLAYGVVVALICWYALTDLSDTAGRGPLAAAAGLAPVCILGLLLTAAQAVTAITSERDLGALDLLLVTDLTPGEFIFGKLWGIAYNAKEYVVPPLLLACVYAWYGMLASPPVGHEELRTGRNIVALVCLLVVLLVLFAFVTVLGVHIGLRTESSRLAITHTLGAVFFLSAGTLLCVWLILISGRFEVQWTSFLLFLFAGIAGFWWVLNGERPSRALTLGSWLCPVAVLYAVMNLVIGKPLSQESADPIVPSLVIAGAFGFTIFAMLMPLLGEFDVALGRTTGPDE